MQRPVVFLGPSMPIDAARAILDADYRPPVRRGDLVDLPPLAVVALIDGVFDQDLAVSLREVHEAVVRGVVVFGGSSMGALRAAEVPGVVGVGQVYEWYRSGHIHRDDEVALLFDHVSREALTVPTVNVRFAVERLVRSGTIDRETSDAIVTAAVSLSYVDRTYPAILRAAGILDRADSDDLVAMLLAHDLKRQDAQAVLEAVDRHCAAPVMSGARSSPQPMGAAGGPLVEGASPGTPATDDDLLIWESGDRVDFRELVRFLALSGRLDRVVRAVMTSGALAGAWLLADTSPRAGAAQAWFSNAARRWGWMSPEEADATLTDLGLSIGSLDQYIAAVVAWDAAVTANARTMSAELLDALRAELFLDDMALKRDILRWGALTFLAERATGNPDPDDLREARAVLCKVNRAETPAALEKKWSDRGLAPEAQAAFVELDARARRAASGLADRMNGRGVGPTLSPQTALSAMPLRPCPKPHGEGRFSRPLAESGADARRLADVIGVSRIGFVGELAELGGVQIAQVARPSGAWSSSYGSGKALTADGAVVGGVMEEIEKWAQEHFEPDDTATTPARYEDVAGDDRFVAPSTLDLPYDSCYRPDQVLRWHPCADLLRGQQAFLPLDVLTMRRLAHDICFSARGARKHLATNGLGSAFTLEEAVLHATCEFVERHALRLAELFLVNPGGLGPHPYRFVDLATASDRVRSLAERLAGAGLAVRVLDITADVAVPTFLTVILRDGRRAEGSAAHPHPDTAIEMSLLEAAQTIASAVAGAREDLSIKARSLGRHERPRPVDVGDLWFWLDPDARGVPVSSIAGLSSNDVLEEACWVLDRLHQAGIDHCCVLDLSREELSPARVVRVVIPGLESNNPFFTGERARLVLLRDLLPRWR